MLLHSYLSIYTQMLKKFFMFCQQEINFYFGTEVVCIAKTFLQKH